MTCPNHDEACALEQFRHRVRALQAENVELRKRVVELEAQLEEADFEGALRLAGKLAERLGQSGPELVEEARRRRLAMRRLGKPADAESNECRAEMRAAMEET